MVPLIGLWSVIVAFSDHSKLLSDDIDDIGFMGWIYVLDIIWISCDSLHA